MPYIIKANKYAFFSVFFLVILKPFKVTVEDQYVIGTGGTAIFTCSYPKDVSAYVKLKRWWINKEIVKLSEHLVINDIQNSHTNDLYYCMVENVLTGEIIASNVAKLFIRKASGMVLLFITNLIVLFKNDAMLFFLFDCLIVCFDCWSLTCLHRWRRGEAASTTPPLPPQLSERISQVGKPRPCRLGQVAN